VQVSGGHHLYFDVEAFAFLFDRSIQVASVELQLDLRGNYKGTQDEVTIDLNGIQAVAAGQSAVYRLIKRDQSANRSRCGFDVHKMRLNGAEPFMMALLRIMKNKGEIKVSLHGKNLHLESAVLLVKGSTYEKCPDPEPTPQPSPSPAVPPKTAILGVSPTGAVVASTTMSISFESDQLGVTYECSLDDGAASTCASPMVYSNLENGGHTFKVTSQNAAGLSDTVGASYSWRVDTVAPDVTITNAAGLPAVSNATSLSLEFASADAVSYTCSIDDGEFKPCSSPVSFNGLAEGTHHVSILGQDAVGNTSETPATFGWTVDLTPPQTVAGSELVVCRKRERHVRVLC
jgi:hypothetical protein